MLVKIIFREFLGFEPEWQTSHPDLKSMLMHADAALIIGDPAMNIPRDQFRVFDLRNRCGTSSLAADSSLRCGWRERKASKRFALWILRRHAMKDWRIWMRLLLNTSGSGLSDEEIEHLFDRQHCLSDG